MANNSIVLMGSALDGHDDMAEGALIEKLEVTTFEKIGDDLQATFTTGGTGHDGIRVEVRIPFATKHQWIAAIGALDEPKAEPEIPLSIRTPYAENA